MNRTMTEINVNDHKEQEDSGLIAAIIIFSGSLLITLAALVSCTAATNKSFDAVPTVLSPTHTQGRASPVVRFLNFRFPRRALSCCTGTIYTVT